MSSHPLAPDQPVQRRQTPGASLDDWIGNVAFGLMTFSAAVVVATIFVLLLII